MKTLKTLADVRAVVASSEKEVFVRWSRGPVADAKMGWVSKNHATGSYEGGLSVNHLDLDSDYEALSLIAEYVFLDQPVCYLVAGERAGVGSDGEPVIVDCEPLARIHASLVWAKEAREGLRLQASVEHETAFLSRLKAEGCECATTLGLAAARLATAQAQLAALASGADWWSAKKIVIR